MNHLFRMTSGAALGGALALAPVAVAFNDDAAIALMPTGQVGSGGVASPTVVFAGFRWSDSSGNVSLRTDAPLPADRQLAYVRDVLGTGITDLAELLDVARPTVYAWLQGAEPRGEHLDRLQRIEQLARVVEAHGLAGAGKLLKRPLQSGVTVLQLIKGNQPIDAALSELAALANLEERQRSARKGGKPSMTATQASAAQSMPGYPSDT